MHLSPYYILNVPENSSMENVNSSFSKLQKKYRKDSRMLEIINSAYNEIVSSNSLSSNSSNFNNNQLTNYNRDYTFDVPQLFRPSLFEQNLFNMFPSDGFGHRNINFNNENDPEHISNFSQSFSSYSYTDENGDIITKTQNRENNNGKVRKSSKEYINNKEIDSTGSKLKWF